MYTPQPRPTTPPKTAKPKQIVLAVDWDGVIHDRAHPIDGKRFGPPLPGAAEALSDLHELGIRIVVFTCVAHTPSGWQAVTDWLEHHDIDYDEVTAVKPIAHAYIDDKGIRHYDWANTLQELDFHLGINTDD